MEALEKQRLDEDGELERNCCHCKEWWPADREFFYGYINEEGKEVLHSWCKACWLEYRRGKRVAKKALVAVL